MWWRFSLAGAPAHGAVRLVLQGFKWRSSKFSPLGDPPSSTEALQFSTQ